MSAITKYPIEIDVKPTVIVSAICKAPFDEALKALAEEKDGFSFKIIPLWLNALLREQQGYQSSISQTPNWVREGDLYIPRENTRLLQKSLCLNNPTAATQAHRENREYSFLSPDEIEKARQEGLEIQEKDLDKNGNLTILTDRLGDNKYGIFLFGGEGADEEKSKRARTHGKWLMESPQKISEIVIYFDKVDYIKNVGKPYANQLWFRGLGGRSGLDGGGRYLDSVDRARGVREGAEGASQNFETYSLNKISRALNSVGISGALEKQILEACKSIKQ